VRKGLEMKVLGRDGDQERSKCAVLHIQVAEMLSKATYERQRVAGLLILYTVGGF
jgi:hypothetical protein